VRGHEEPGELRGSRRFCEGLGVKFPRATRLSIPFTVTNINISIDNLNLFYPAYPLTLDQLLRLYFPHEALKNLTTIIVVADSNASISEKILRS